MDPGKIRVKEQTIKPAFILNEKDNVATALMDLERGTRIEDGVGGRKVSVVVAENIAFGHKLALEKLARGDKIIKYGEVIGQATADIAPGAHVHVHNVESLRGRK